MSKLRLERLKGYSDPVNGGDAPHGAASNKSNIDDWIDRATRYSDGADHRAKDGPMKLPSTKMTVRDTAMRPKASRKVDNAMVEGRSDPNHYGSSYLRGIRRGV
jgi:hypothetical protein